MGIDITEIAQKVLDNNTNAANVFRKMYDLHYNPNPLDVPFEYIDENGEKVTTTIKNQAAFRKKVWDDVGGALGQFNRTFYVDAVNGDDNNTGASDSPFKSLKKAIDSVPDSGKGYIIFKSDYTLEENINIGNKHIVLDGNNNQYSFTSKEVTQTLGSTDYDGIYHISGTNTIIFYRYKNINVPTHSGSNSVHPINSSLVGGNFQHGLTLNVGVFYSNNLNIYKDFNFIDNYNWNGGYGQLVYQNWSLTITKNDTGVLINLNGSNLVVGTDSSTKQDSSGNSIGWTDLINGIVKDSNGVPRNVQIADTI